MKSFVLAACVCLTAVPAIARTQTKPCEELKAEIEKRTLVQLSRAARLTPAELQNALDRLGRDLGHFAVRDLTLDLCQWRTMPIVSTPRSLDLAHLRTALWFHQRQALTRFVSLAAPQNQAARELGLPV